MRVKNVGERISVMTAFWALSIESVQSRNPDIGSPVALRINDFKKYGAEKQKL